MKPSSMMWLGAVAAVVAFAADLMSLGDSLGLEFIAGALFGKGYGIWEERCRRSNESRAK